MKLKVSLMVCTASLFVAFPILAQSNGNGSDHSGHDNDGNSAGHRRDEPHGFGNGSDHSGHDEDGNSADHRQDEPHGFGDNLVLATPAATAAVATAMTSVTSTLKSGSLTTPAGAVIPSRVQSFTYSVLTSDPALSASSRAIAAALSTAGPAANAIVPSLIRSFSQLRSNPRQLPSTIAEYNRFANAASAAFLSNPPPEFLALHTVLARLTAATIAPRIAAK
jgi:hypothetical protein